MKLRLVLASGFLAFTVGVYQGHAAPPPTAPDADPAMEKLFQQARKLIDAKKLPAAIQKCDQVIERFEQFYADRNEKVYCARTAPEKLGYLVMAANEFNRGTAKKTSAVALSPTWSNAFYMKGYALLELQRRAEAKSAINRALELAPWNAQYLCELGNIYQLEKNWPEARKAFLLAEEQAALSPDDVKADELARARRGLGYVLVELGQFEAAAQKYQQCLAANPQDKKAVGELEYVRGLQKEKASK